MKALPKFIGYIVLKWVLFYIYQFTEGNTKWSFYKVNGEGLFLAAFMLLILPLAEIAILFFPFHFALKQNGKLTVLILIVAFGLEFLLGWYAINQHFETWMAVKIILSAGLFWLMYRKRLIVRCPRSPTSEIMTVMFGVLKNRLSENRPLINLSILPFTLNY